MSALVETEIGTIASGWKVAPLEVVCEPPQYGYTTSAEEEGNVRLLRITDITDSGVTWSTVPFCECPPKLLDKYRLMSDDIVFARIGATTGKSYLITDPPPSVFASYLIRVRVKREIDPLFLSQFFRSDAYWRQVDAQKNANLKKGVSGSLLKTVLVPVPPLPEQRKIAGVLGVVQRAIEQQERLLALTAELKNALLHKLFTEGLRGEPQKQTEIGPVPKSWRVSRLDEFCLLQRGFDITKKEQVAGNVPVVSSGGIASYHNVAKVKGPGVLVGRKGTLGKVHYLDVDYWPHDTTLWVKDFKGHDPLFTSFFLKTLRFERYNSGASNPTLNRNTVHAELVAYPHKEEQVEIGRVLKTVEDKTLVHERKHRALGELFRTLLNQLMTAQVRVHDLHLPELETFTEG